jgi:thymidylate synthase (FAD)
MCEIKLYIKAPLFVVRQWVRHRTANFNEYSGRYSEMPNEFYFPSPDMLQKQSKNNKQCSEGQFEDAEYQKILAIMQNITNSAHDEYRKLLDLGVARETARCILPLNVYTHFYWKIDAHNLMHFLKLRCEKNSQSEIRAYANEILKIFAEWMPITYEAFVDYVIKAESYSDQAHQVLLQAVDQDCVDDLISQDTSLSQREKNVLRNRLTKTNSDGSVKD